MGSTTKHRFHLIRSDAESQLQRRGSIFGKLRTTEDSQVLATLSACLTREDNSCVMGPLPLWTAAVKVIADPAGIDAVAGVTVVVVSATSP